MANFASLTAKLNLDISNFAKQLNKASGKMDKFAADINGKSVSAMKQLNKQTNAWGLNLKSVSRVVSGILISQAFYGAAQDIKQAAKAVWEFSKELEYAQIAYSNLFGDTSLAEEFVNVLKDFAAKTPFSFTESEKAAKRLLAYGIEYKNVMYVLQGVLSASSIQGDATKIEAISRALGQIYTYGKLMTQEVRQLSEAGIPAYEILQEELGLTKDQLKDLGNQAIPASVAINALVDGIQKRFGSTTVAAAKTMTGIISNIKDNATMLFAGLFTPFNTFIKSALSVVGDFLFKLRDMYELKGAGGVFEALFPKEMHGIIRQFIANISVLVQSILRLAYAVSGLLKPAFTAFMMVFNAFAPILTTMLNVLAALIKLITSNATAMKILTTMLAAAAAMWVVFKVKAIACFVITKVINAISKSLAFLSSVLTFVVAHPFWTLLIAFTGIVIGLSFGFDNLSKKISNLFSSLTKFNGLDPDKLLLPSQKERANDLGKFNEKLEITAEDMDTLADKTKKAAKNLLSFDEVFRLNEPDEGTTDGIQVPDISIPDMSDFTDGFMPEVPDFSEYFKDFNDGFTSNLKDMFSGLKEKLGPIIDKAKKNIEGLLSTALGALFGGLLGFLLGGKLGGIIGALVGGIVGYFWNKLADEFGLSPDQKARAGIITGIGTGIGALLGFILGGPTGAKIGASIGFLVGSLWGMISEKLGVIPEQHMATGISGALQAAFASGFSLFASLAKGLVPTWTNGKFSGFSTAVGFSFKNSLMSSIKTGALGAIAGLATGMIANGLTAYIKDEYDLTEEDLKNSASGQKWGNIMGSIVGGLIGGPAGSIVGGSLGQLAGAVIGEFWNYLSNMAKGSILGTSGGATVGAIVGAIVGLLGGPIGAGLGAAIGAGLGLAVGTLSGYIADNWEPIKGFFADTKQNIADWSDSAKEKFGQFKDSAKEKFDGFKEDMSGLKDTIGEKVEGIKAFFNDLPYNIGYAMGSAAGHIANFAIEVKQDFDTFMNETLPEFISNVQENWDTFWSETFPAVIDDIWLFFHDAKANFDKFWSEDLPAFIENVGEDWNEFWKVTFPAVIDDIWLFFHDAKAKFDKFWSEDLPAFIENVSEDWNEFWDVTFPNVMDSIGEFFDGLWDKFYGWGKDIIDGFIKGFKEKWEKFKSDWGSLIDGFKDGFNASVSFSGSTSGHATGGVFDREHVARFAEGNKAEAIIPLENDTAMQPFVDAVANGITASLAPILANINGSSQQSQLQPLYVGTLIADDRSLKELERKMEVIRVQESKR